MNATPLVRTFGIGAVAGSRSMMAPALTLAACDSRWTGLAAVAAAGELVADKLPIAPSRLTPPGLIVRVVSGAFCGRTIARRREASTTLGALAGALGALAGAFGGYHARKFLTVTKGWPDFPVALAEDAFAFSLARAATAAAP